MSKLESLLRSMDPVLNPGVYVYCISKSSDGDAMVGWFHEAEGITVIIEEEEARKRRWEAKFPCRWITLNVESEFTAVGFIAAVSNALAEAQIPCNVVSASHHDHLFIPAGKAEEAMDVLRSLQTQFEGTE